MGSATVTFQDGMKVTAKNNAFLANTEKKKAVHCHVTAPFI